MDLDHEKIIETEEDTFTPENQSVIDTNSESDGDTTLVADYESKSESASKVKHKITPYNIYVRDNFEKKRTELAVRPAEIMILLSTEWKNLSPEEKEKYEQIAFEINKKHGLVTEKN